MADSNKNELSPPISAEEKRKHDNSVRARRNTIILLSVIALVGVVGYFIVVRTPNTSLGDNASNVVSFPTVSSSLMSSKDGTIHTIDIDLSLEYTEGVELPDSENILYERMKLIISNLDYEVLRSPDSIDYIVSEVKTGIKDLAGENGISNVYVGNIAIDDFKGYVTSDPFPSKNSSKPLFNDISK